MTSNPSPADSGRGRFDLFAISLLILFLELACIRWFPAHVLYLTFFTNTVLLACFLGMSLGCLTVRHSRNYLAWTPAFLGLSMVLALGVDFKHNILERYLDVGHQSSPQLVFFGTEIHGKDVEFFHIPMEVLAGTFFLLIALAMVGPGQVLGRALTRLPNRLHAYTLNILGSIAGIVLFAGSSYLELSPIWWFVPVVLGIAYFLRARARVDGQPVSLIQYGLLGVVLVASLTALSSGTGPSKHFWSPYYYVDYTVDEQLIWVNRIGHQYMASRDQKIVPYALPYLLNRDSGGAPVNDVLIIGAGSGNDVSRALQWGDKDVKIDAVEIDPVIRRLGNEHPDQPYQDPRVTTYVDDGRNFLHAGDKKYDLIVFALVDSLVLHSGYSNIRLESYLFTRQSFEDVKRRLKPGGRFLMYNFFRQGWIVARLKKGLEEVFGNDNPIVFMLPYEDEVPAEKFLDRSYTLVMAGNTEPLKQAFATRNTGVSLERQYWLRTDEAPAPATPNGFDVHPPPGDEANWARFGPATVEAPAVELRTATDDWPFLYLRQPMIPLQPTLSGMAVMGALALILVLAFVPRRQGTWPTLDGRMFFLGAGFMLIETKAVVHGALLFGSTWMVNTFVFFAVLVMILLANLFVLVCKPVRIWPFYAGLFVALLLNAVVPLDYFLGMARTPQVLTFCLLVMAPLLFASVIFALSFSRTPEADRAFGMNVAGAMLGGLSENASMILGFQHLVLLALCFYALSIFSRRAMPQPAPELALAGKE